MSKNNDELMTGSSRNLIEAITVLVPPETKRKYLEMADATPRVRVSEHVRIVILPEIDRIYEIWKKNKEDESLKAG